MTAVLNSVLAWTRAGLLGVLLIVLFVVAAFLFWYVIAHDR
jgi:hypothetical protein